MKKLILTTSILLLAAACSKPVSPSASRGGQAQVQPASPDASQGGPVQNQPAQTVQENGQQNGTVTPTPLPMANPRIQGILKISDNSSKGNLMLVENDAMGDTSGKHVTIYLQTKRDFSALLNKQVIAWIDGLAGQFILKDVTEVK